MFNFPLICVGNLALGGTGKTPMTEYLVVLFKDKYVTATLSRGYKRKTKGFAIANANTTAVDIGDEPMQLHQKFPDITVSVGEERLEAIPLLLHDRPDTQVIILDDAFQHRSVKAGMNILLTDYRNLYTRDLLLPAGDLRDVVVSRKRADIIIVTKCKPTIDYNEKEALINEINPLPHQQIYFTDIVYTEPYHLFNRTTEQVNENSDVLLLCGIANPKPLKDFLTEHVNSYDMLRYADHHIFTSDDLKDIVRHYDNMESENKIIVTTEKDSVRLEKFRNELKDYPIYVFPIKHRFLFGEGAKFDEAMLKYVNDILW